VEYLSDLCISEACNGRAYNLIKNPISGIKPNKFSRLSASYLITSTSWILAFYNLFNLSPLVTPCGDTTGSGEMWKNKPSIPGVLLK
jgi:hypothetical protein